MLEKTLESSFDSKEIKSVNPKGNQPWIFIGRTDAEAEAPILCPPDVKSWVIGKYPDAGKDKGREEKGATENEMIGWHHWLNGHESEQTLGDSEGQGSLACYSSWGHKEPDRRNLETEQHVPADLIISLASTSLKYVRFALRANGCYSHWLSSFLLCQFCFLLGHPMPSRG